MRGPRCISWLFFVAFLLAQRPAIALEIVRSGLDALCVGSTEYFTVVSPQPWIELQWYVTGPSGIAPLPINDPQGDYTFLRSGLFTVVATAEFDGGAQETATLQVSIPRPVAIVVFGQPGALTRGRDYNCSKGDLMNIAIPKNDHDWCWIRSIGYLAAQRLQLAGWSTVVLDNAPSPEELDAAIQPGQCIQGIYYVGHGGLADGFPFLKLSATSGVFGEGASLTPYGLAPLVNYRIGALRHLTLIACAQDPYLWMNEVAVYHYVGPATVPPRVCMKPFNEYAPLETSNHGIWPAALDAVAPASAVPSARVGTLVNTSCQVTTTPFPDYDYIMDLETADWPFDPYAPQACATRTVTSTVPVTIESPDGMWSLTPYVHPDGGDVPISAVSRSRLPELGGASGPEWRFLRVEYEPTAAIDSARVTLRYTDQELRNLGAAAASLRMWFMPWTGGLEFLPTTVDSITREGSAWLPGPGTVFLIPALTTGLESNTTPSAGGFRLTAFPNPTRGLFLASFYLAAGARVRAEVISILGQRVATGERWYESGGLATLPIQLPERLAPGTYFVRIQTPAGSAISRVTLVR